jgi:hypothetical protein
MCVIHQPLVLEDSINFLTTCRGWKLCCHFLLWCFIFVSLDYCGFDRRSRLLVTIAQVQLHWKLLLQESGNEKGKESFIDRWLHLCLCAQSISGSERFYKLSNNVLGFIVVVLSHTISCVFTPRGSWSHMMFYDCFYERQWYSLTLSITCCTDDIIAKWLAMIVVIVTKKEWIVLTQSLTVTNSPNSH